MVKNFLGHGLLRYIKEITQDTMNKHFKLRNDKCFLKDNAPYSGSRIRYTKIPFDRRATCAATGSHTAISWGFCIGKKNWQMIDTINGAKTSAMIYSIAETAKVNNLKQYEYFEYLLEEIPKYMDDTYRSFQDRLLPWSAELPEHIRKTK